MTEEFEDDDSDDDSDEDDYNDEFLSTAGREAFVAFLNGELEDESGYIINKYNEFIDNFIETEIERSAKKSIIIDMDDLSAIDTHLLTTVEEEIDILPTLKIINFPEKNLPILDELFTTVLERRHSTDDFDIRSQGNYHVRIKNINPLTAGLEEVKSSKVGKLIQIKGEIIE